MISKALEEIKKYDRIIIHRHSNPDGDAMGSQIGLKHILKTNFPQKHIYVVGDEAKRFSFMRDSVMDDISDDVYNGALAIILDTSAKSLISDNRYALAARTLRIDHHIFCENIADVDIDDTSFESCCGLITSLAIEWGLTVPEIAAQSLFTGMVTDSGRFRYDATTPRTLRLAAFLIEHGANICEIYNKLYEDDFDMIKLRASFIMQIQFTKNNVAYIFTPLNRVIELERQGVSAFSLSRGMVNTMAEIKGVDIWVNFTETQDGILCELRSKSQNINKIAVKYGGGGHVKASGATLKDKDEVMAMLADLDVLSANLAQNRTKGE